MNLSRELIDRWYGELEILKRLDHPNVVKAQDLPEGLEYLSNMTNTPFICMEFCDGGDLRQVGVARPIFSILYSRFMYFVSVSGSARSG